jgi:hypothetical protein
MSDSDPQAVPADVLARTTDRPFHSIDELLP